MTLGWSTSRAGQETYLKKSYIEAIEAGNFEELPGGLFNKTFVQIYARELGIPDSALAGFYKPQIEEISDARELVVNNASAVPAPQGQIRPPRFAEYLLYFFLTSGERINLIGDTEEEYREVHGKFGKRKANAWYYKQVFDSLRPLIRRSVTKLSIVIWTAKHTSKISEFFQNLFKDISK